MGLYVILTSNGASVGHEVTPEIGDIEVVGAAFASWLALPIDAEGCRERPEPNIYAIDENSPYGGIRLESPVVQRTAHYSDGTETYQITVRTPQNAMDGTTVTVRCAICAVGGGLDEHDARRSIEDPYWYALKNRD